MSDKTGTATLTDHLARWTSILFDSSVLSLFVFPIIGWQGDRWRGILWALIAIVLLSGIPLAYLLVSRRRGWVHDLELSDRRDRPRFILVSLFSDLLTLLVLGLGHAPSRLWSLALVYACLGLIMFTISNFWKISLHMVSVGGFATVLMFAFGWKVWWTFLSLPLVAWARLHRRKHTPGQLVAGAVGGILITTIVLDLAR